MTRKTGSAGTTVVALAGELDLASAPDVRAAGFDALAEPGCTTLVLDLEALTFIDSTGIGAWVELRNRAIQNDQRVLLRSVSEQLARILKIAGLDWMFDADSGQSDSDRG